MKSKLRFGFANIYGVYLAFGIIILDIFLAFSRDFEYLGDSLFTIRWFAIDLFVVCPVVAGVVATDVANFSKIGNVHLTKVKNHKQYKWIFVWSILPCAIAHMILPIIMFFCCGWFNLTINGWLSVILG